MANYQLLKADIDAKVYQNGQQEITGANLNSVLNAMVTTLGAEYQFAGVATTTTNPGTPDAKVFYIANGKGTYTNFGGLEVTEDDVVVLYWDTAWHKEATGIASQEKLTELESEVSQLGQYVVDDLFYDKSKVFTGSETSTQNLGVVSCNMKKGDTLKCVASGLRTVARQYYLRLNGDTYGTPMNLENMEFELPFDVTDFAVQVLASHILSAGTFGVQVTHIGTIDNKIKEVNSKYIPLIETNNLFKVDLNCLDGYKINTSNGRLVEDANYWVSGAIPVDSTLGNLIIMWGCESVVAYRSNNLFYTAMSGEANLNPVSLDSNMGYVRINFKKVDLPYDDRFKIRVFYATNNSANFTHESIDINKRTIKDNQFFTLTDILPFASVPTSHKFTSNFNFWLNNGCFSNKNMIISCRAMYKPATSGTRVYPTIRVFQYKPNSFSTALYEGCYYEIGGNGEYVDKEWRIPPADKWTLTRIQIYVPSGAELYIDRFENYYSDKKNLIGTGYRADGHITQNAQFCTKESIMMCAKLGFPACITIPKRTSDGVWVCFHDDTEIGKSLVDGNGQTLEEPEYSASISDITYERLCELSYPQRYGGIIPKVPTLEDFFVMCAKLNLKPVLSVHPTPSIEHYAEIKEMALKLGVLKYLTVKPLSVGAGIASAYEVFGDDIDAYIAQSHGAGVSSAISQLHSVSFDRTKVKVGVEVYDDASELNDTNVNEILGAGYFVSVYHYHGAFTAKDIESWIKKGVQEWTEETNCSYGLNW